ncbi:MAG: hypothetical protein A2W25_00805 [candidate division Zixibacteria bacterium RBG_16_53_22]|nr:MAG: hypothetical protein A2W25_00805 [candidate division Zixibacteria bacterium RBG_16_53_22]
MSSDPKNDLPGLSSYEPAEISLDIGSRSIKSLAFNPDGLIIMRSCLPIKGQIRDCLRNILVDCTRTMGERRCLIRSLTGTGSEPFAHICNIKSANEILSAQLGALAILPEANSILEIGGEHAKFIRLSRRPPFNGPVLRDFFKNSVCSAGTGGFLEQEIHRLDLTIDDFCDLAVRSHKTIHVSGRCCVFAKTDIVHQHQNGASIEDIAYALCFAIAQNIVGELIANRKFETPLALIGGVAGNAGVARALRRLLDLDDNSLITPEDALYASCLGAYISAVKTPDAVSIDVQRAIQRLDLWRPDTVQRKNLAPLVLSERHHDAGNPRGSFCKSPDDFIAGLDIGSTSTKLVCISPANEIIESVCVPTRGQAFSAMADCIGEVRRKLGQFSPRAVAVTGSGRNLIGKLIGADLIINEITAHAFAANYFLSDVDTIFDIGGQDSKFARLENGCLSYFDMNKVCSAGTGSFLEEMSQLLGLDIIGEFSREALSSRAPVDLGERCTIFMSSELVRCMHGGYSRADLAAGLCYSIVNNYRHRVIGSRRPGNVISFQGGVAGNIAIVAAMENIFQRDIHVHPYYMIAGAIGAAMLASKRAIRKTNFKGLENSVNSERINSFECRHCANSCLIYFSGSRQKREIITDGLCERYSAGAISRKIAGSDGQDLFEERRRAITANIDNSTLDRTKTIGIPNALIFHETTPFWGGFFGELGISYKFSRDTDRGTVSKGMSACPVKTCFSMKIGYGHCRHLIDDGFKHIFIPSVGNLSFGTMPERLNHICPSVQAWPFMARSIFPKEIDFLTPTFRFAIPELLKRDATDFARDLGASHKRALRAFQAGLDSQAEFLKRMESRGKEIFSGLGGDAQYAVLLSRPYLYADRYIQLRLKKVFGNSGIIPIPMEMCRTRPESRRELSGMYWYFGRKFLQIAHEFSKTPNMPFIFLSNYGCGSDSFIIHFLREALRGRPFLELEIDEHSEFIGLSTRLEAFADTIRHKKLDRPRISSKISSENNGDWKDRRLLLPRMSDHAMAFAAALRSCGVDAQVMPLSGSESDSLGGIYVTGQECLPCTMIIGDMLTYLRTNNDGSRPPAFFMISGDGPCRLGQYPYLQRQVLRECGYPDIPIFDASQDQSFYEKLGSLSRRFKTRAWEGSVATDILFRKWRQCRPYAPDIRGIDEIYEQGLQEISKCIESNGSLRRQLRNSFTRLERQIPGKYAQRPVIALLGENYVRCNAAANRNIANALEDLGVEVYFPSLTSWIYYTNWTAMLHCLYERQYRKYGQIYMINILQRMIEYRLSSSVAGRLKTLREPMPRKVFSDAAPFVPRTFEGETVISIARAFDFHKRGACGIIHLVPFGCIVGSIVETISESLSEDLGGLPMMTLHFDIQPRDAPLTEIENFVIRAKTWNENGRRL